LIAGMHFSPGETMLERSLNAFWILLGLAAASYAWTLGLVGPSGPESGLFPFIAALIIAGCGIALSLSPSHWVGAPDWPRGAGLGRVAGVLGGLALMAAAIPTVGFTMAGAVIMLLLLRVVERTPWSRAIPLALLADLAVVGLFERLLGLPLPRGPWGW
jgi:putative tricarboxylic transport membrane protein